MARSLARLLVACLEWRVVGERGRRSCVAECHNYLRDEGVVACLGNEVPYSCFLPSSRGVTYYGWACSAHIANVLSSFPLCQQQVLWQRFHSKSCAAEARGEHARAAALPIISCADSGFRIGMKVLISQARLARPLSLDARASERGNEPREDNEGGSIRGPQTALSLSLFLSLQLQLPPSTSL